MPNQRLCEITRISGLSGDSFEMWFDAGEIAMQASPGQFINIKCGEERLLRRPISICERADNELRVIFDVRGEGTQWLSQRKPGDLLDVLGPLGHGFHVDGEKILFVGGGIGVPPLLWAAKACTGESNAVLGFRSADKGLLIEEFKKICRRVDVISDDGSLGARGFADAAVRHRLAEGEGYARVCACGPKGMLRAVAAVAAEYHIPCEVSMEERMGCGVGACLVCACKTKGKDGGEEYSHVCKNGPVFDAEQVIWDD